MSTSCSCSGAPCRLLKQSKNKAAASRKADGQSERPPERSAQIGLPSLVVPAVIDKLIGNDRIGSAGRPTRYGSSYPRIHPRRVGSAAETHPHSARGRTMKRFRGGE